MFAFDTKGNLVEYKVLVKRAATLPEPELTALEKFGNFLYVASYDDSTGAVIYSYDGRAKKLFSIAGGKVLTMLAYNDVLYMGLNNGRIMSYDGSVASTVYVATSAITRLRTDGAVLYATVQGGGEFLTTVDGVAWKINLF